MKYAGIKSRRPGRRAAGAAAVILVSGVAVAGVAYSRWEHPRDNVSGAAGTAADPPPPAPAGRSAPIPPEAMLNGSYRLTLEDSRSKYVHSSAADWAVGSADVVGYIKFSTRCTGSTCVATSAPTSDPRGPAAGLTVETMVWESGRWSSRQAPIPDGDGIDKSTTILRPDGRHGFLGTTTDTIVSGPHAGAERIAPVLLTLRFDPANL